jgi:hypothetical protein
MLVEKQLSFQLAGNLLDDQRAEAPPRWWLHGGTVRSTTMLRTSPHWSRAHAKLPRSTGRRLAPMSRDHRGLIDNQLSQSNWCPIEVPPCRHHSIAGHSIECARPRGKMIALGFLQGCDWGLQMMNECSNAGLPDRMREAATSNNTAMRRDRSRASLRRLPSACNSSRDIWLTRGGGRSEGAPHRA